MNPTSKGIRIVVGAVMLIAFLWFLTRNQIVAEFIRPKVDSGQLGVATANLLISVLEIVAALGGLVIAILTRVVAFIADSIEPLLMQALGIGHRTVPDSANGSDPQKLLDDLSRLLIQAVAEGNRELTIQLAHRLARKRFLDGSDGE